MYSWDGQLDAQPLPITHASFAPAAQDVAYWSCWLYRPSFGGIGFVADVWGVVEAFSLEEVTENMAIASQFEASFCSFAGRPYPDAALSYTNHLGPVAVLRQDPLREAQMPLCAAASPARITSISMYAQIRGAKRLWINAYNAMFQVQPALVAHAGVRELLLSYGDKIMQAEASLQQQIRVLVDPERTLTQDAPPGSSVSSVIEAAFSNASRYLLEGSQLIHKLLYLESMNDSAAAAAGSSSPAYSSSSSSSLAIASKFAYDSGQTMCGPDRPVFQRGLVSIATDGAMMLNSHSVSLAQLNQAIFRYEQTLYTDAIPPHVIDWNEFAPPQAIPSSSSSSASADGTSSFVPSVMLLVVPLREPVTQHVCVRWLDGEPVLFPLPLPTASDITVLSTVLRSPPVSGIDPEQQALYAYTQYQYDRRTRLLEVFIDPNEADRLWASLQLLRTDVPSAGAATTALSAAIPQVEISPEVCARVRQVVSEFTAGEVARQTLLAQQIQDIQARYAASPPPSSAEPPRSSSTNPPAATASYSIGDFDNDDNDDHFYPSKSNDHNNNNKNNDMLVPSDYDYSEYDKKLSHLMEQLPPPTPASSSRSTVVVGKRTRQQKREALNATAAALLSFALTLLLVGVLLSVFWGAGIPIVAIALFLFLLVLILFIVAAVVYAEEKERKDRQAERVVITTTTTTTRHDV